VTGENETIDVHGSPGEPLHVDLDAAFIAEIIRFHAEVDIDQAEKAANAVLRYISEEFRMARRAQ
jgi:hypothetical protein